MDIYDVPNVAKIKSEETFCVRKKKLLLGVEKLSFGQSSE
jgi:hypothetical protein